MLARKMMQVETKWERAEDRFKTHIYTLLHEMLQAQIKSPIIYKLLLFIETVQFFWFGIHPNFDFLWTANVATWIRTGVRYFQLDYVLNTGNKSVFLVALYIVFVVQILTILLAIITAFQLTRSKKKNSTVVTYSLKILSSVSVLLNTVCTLPVFNIYLASIICVKGDSIHNTGECYTGVYFLYLATGIIGLILGLIELFMLTSLYIDLNPWSTIPFAAPRSKIPLLRLFLKLAVILYFILDYKKNLTKEFIVIYGVIWLGMVILRYRQTPHYNRSIFRFVLAMDSIMLWTCIVSITHAFLDKGQGNNIGIFFLFFGYPFLAYAVITIVERRQSAFRRLIVKNLKKDDNVEMYINVVFNLIENRDKPLPRIALEGLLKYHIKHCQKKENECACWSLSREFGKEEEPPEKLWYTWIKHIIVDVLENFPKSTRLHMLYAYIQREKLQNKFKALFEMMITEENKPNMEEEFSIFSYKNVIEEEMIENDARNSESKGVDVNVIVDFQNKFVDFQAAVENAVDLHLEFWRELLENNPDIQKLQTLGSKITHSLEETSAEFRKLNDINPNHIKMLQIYGNYLKDIVNDEVEGQRTLEKAEYVDKSAAVNKQFIDNDHLKYGENSNTCIFTVSGNLSSIGTIKNVNNEITRILGFSKPDLIGQNISRIIPKVIGDLHDGFMKNYFETSEAKVMGIERIVFPLNKEGYVVPCSLMIKVLPNLDEGIRLVGFLKDLDKEGAFSKGTDMEMEEKVHYIMYSGDSLAIHGITYSCKKSFGIPASLVSGHGASNDFTMDIIFPELHSHSAEDLKNAAGVVMTLDTSSLQQNYLLGDSHSNGSEYREEEEEEEEEKEKKFRKANVRVVLAEDVDYQDTNIKVLKFVEVYEEDFKREFSATKNEMEAKENAKDVLGKTEDESKVEPGDRSAEYNGGSDKDSMSAGEGVNDEIKQLKDFKALISEKTVPKSIKLLSRIVILLLLLLIVLTILILKFRIDQASEFKTGISDITQAYDRTDLMANINFQTRELQVLARGLITTSSPATVAAGFQTALITLIDSLSTVQFNIMRSAEVLQNDGVNTMDSQNIFLEHLVEGGVTIDSRIYTDSVFQYITAASSVRSSALTSIITTDSTDSTPKNFYFVRRNGLGTLRQGSETESSTFYNYYVNRADYYNKIFQALMIVAIALLVISDFILIPIVFSVHRTNNRVLAFFGYIPLNEIEQLAEKCEQYMEKYLEDHKEAHNYSYDEGEEGERSRVDRSHAESNQMENSSYVEGSQNPEESVVEGDSINPETSMQMDVSERIEVSPVNDFNKGPRQMTLNVPASSTRKNVTGGRGDKPTGNVLPAETSMMKSRPNDMMVSSVENSKAPFNKSRDFIREDAKKVTTTKEEEKKKKEDAELIDIEVNDRIQKLLNSRTNKRSNVVVQFLILAVIFGIYFLLDYLLVELPFRQNVKNILEHMKFTSQRMPFIRYLNAFTLEEIAEGNNTNVYSYSNQQYINLRQMYSKLIQINEQAITNPANLNFPSQFDNYLNLFNSYNDDDLCQSYYAPLGRLAECQSVSNQILTRGLTLAVTTISLNSDTIINTFNTSQKQLTKPYDPTQLKPAQIAAINGDAFSQSIYIQKYIMPAFGHLQDQFEVAYQNFLSNSNKIEAIKFVMFLLFCFLVFFVLWQPYLKNLKDNIFRTKGMLSMIPMDIISKNENLMGVFLTGNILQAVK